MSGCRIIPQFPKGQCITMILIISLKYNIIWSARNSYQAIEKYNIYY